MSRPHLFGQHFFDIRILDKNSAISREVAMAAFGSVDQEMHDDGALFRFLRLLSYFFFLFSKSSGQGS